jgi:hypothetical protein
MSKIFSDNNQGAITFEVKQLLETMKQKDMRRYGDFLFSYYGFTKIYVSIREFVWTHIIHPYLAESTCDAFKLALTESDKSTIVSICVTDLCLPYPLRPVKYSVEACLSDDFEVLCDRVVYNNDNINAEDIEARSVAHSIRWKHPEDTKAYELSSSYMGTLGELGFTNGTKVFLIPEMKLKQN